MQPYWGKNNSQQVSLGKLNSICRLSMKSLKVLPFLNFSMQKALTPSCTEHEVSQYYRRDTNSRDTNSRDTNSTSCFLDVNEVTLTCSLFHLHQHKRSNLTRRIEFSMSLHPGITIGGTDNFKGNILT